VSVIDVFMGFKVERSFSLVKRLLKKFLFPLAG